jgi:hypothetical protein
VGLYTELVGGSGAKTQRVLYPTPGYSTYASTSDAGGRAIFAQDGRCFAVIGGTLFELSNVTTPVTRGTLLNNNAPATIASSGDAGAELWIVSASTGYVYNLAANTLASVASAGTVHQGGYLDGFFLALDTTTSTFKISDLLDGTTWDPTQVVQRSTAPDRWVALLVVNKYIWLFGSETSDVLYDAGSSPFPFAVVPGALVPMGTAAALSPADVNGTPVWLSRTSNGTGMVVRANGFGVPERISTHAVEYAIQRYTQIDDAESTVYQLDGHTIYKLDFPAAGATWCWDAATGDWHEEPYWNATDAVEECSRVRGHAIAFNVHLVLDRESGLVYQQSPDVYTDVGGAALRRVRRCPLPQLGKTGAYVSAGPLQVFMDVGVGLQSGQGSDPQAMLRLSRDGGRTWGIERWRTIGAVGNYQTRVLWPQLGGYREGMGVVELVVSDPVPVRILGAEVN